MSIRTANAVWNGNLKEGNGTINVESGLFKDAPYNFSKRFENEKGTNPEELIAAAHAGCFAMKLSFALQAMNITADSLDVDAEVTLENGSVTSSALRLRAKIPGITEQQFKEATEDAKLNCPISKLLKADISLDASLV